MLIISELLKLFKDSEITLLSMYGIPELVKKLNQPNKLTLCIVYCHDLLESRKDLLSNMDSTFDTPSPKDYEESMSNVMNGYCI